jgi:hypothetical protein
MPSCDYTTLCMYPALLLHGNMMHKFVGEETFARFDHMTFKRLYIDFHDHIIGVYREWVGIEPNGGLNSKNNRKIGKNCSNHTS